jgi:hypothetical protein
VPPGEPSVAELVATLQAQLAGATILGVAQNQSPAGGADLIDTVELTFTLDDHVLPLVFRAPYSDLHSGYLVVSLNAYVANLLRIYALGSGGPPTIVPPPGMEPPPPGGPPPGPQVP